MLSYAKEACSVNGEFGGEPGRRDFEGNFDAVLVKERNEFEESLDKPLIGRKNSILFKISVASAHSPLVRTLGNFSGESGDDASDSPGIHAEFSSVNEEEAGFTIGGHHEFLVSVRKFFPQEEKEVPTEVRAIVDGSADRWELVKAGCRDFALPDAFNALEHSLRG